MLHCYLWCFNTDVVATIKDMNVVEVNLEILPLDILQNVVFFAFAATNVQTHTINAW